MSKRSKALVLTAIVALLSIGLAVLSIALFPHIRDFGTYGYLGVFVVTLVSASTILMPTPGPAVIVAAAAIWNPTWVAMVGSVGGTIGEVTGYLAGRGGRTVIAPTLSERYAKAEGWVKQWGGLAVLLFAAIPFPLFDLVGVAAGAAKFPWWKFLLFCWLGRVPKCFVEAYIGLSIWNIVSH